MDWDKDYDVKEYHPKKKNRVQAHFSGIELPLGGSELRAYKRDGFDTLDGGAMLTTPEILDFAAGSDSFV